MSIGGVPGVGVSPLALDVPIEPVEVRNRLRTDLLDAMAWEEQRGIELALGEVLWAAWGEALASAGFTQEQFASVIVGYRRELWFWIMGERTWSQVASGLAGRLVRRLPA